MENIQEQISGLVSPVGIFECHRCGKNFDKPQALAMHTVRMHTHREKASMAAAKAMSARARAQRIALGNKPFPSQTSEYKKAKYRERVERWRKQGLNAHGDPFKNNAISRGLRKARGVITPKRSPKRTTPFVWPLPGTPNLDAVPNIKFCPHCGTNIEKHLT